MYEKIMILVGIFGIIVGIPIFLKSRRAAKNSESTVAEIIELRKGTQGIIPVVKYEKNNREYKAVHFKSKMPFTYNYSVGDKVVVNIVPDAENEFYFTDEEAIYSAKGLDYILGGGVCLIIGIILYIVLAK